MKKTLAFIVWTALLIGPALAAGAPAGPANPLDGYTAEVVREATCAEGGLVAYTNAETGGRFTLETAPTGAHDYVAATTAPTCTEPGRVTYTCSVCGDTYTEETEPAAGHDYTYRYDAVREEDGTFSDFGTWECEVCGAVAPATEAHAVYYYGLLDAESRAAEPEAPDGEPADDGETAGAAADMRGGAWLAVEIAAAVFLIAEVAGLLISLRRKQPF